MAVKFLAAFETIPVVQPDAENARSEPLTLPNVETIFYHLFYFASSKKQAYWKN